MNYLGALLKDLCIPEDLLQLNGHVKIQDELETGTRTIWTKIDYTRNWQV